LAACRDGPDKMVNASSLTTNCDAFDATRN
jgi:hypothetical protein